jgi:hypothetical protein
MGSRYVDTYVPRAGSRERCSVDLLHECRISRERKLPAVSAAIILRLLLYSDLI